MKSNNRSIFSKNLIKLRKERSLSQSDLAEITGLSQRMITYYENEAVKPPVDKIELIANALNVGITDLLGTIEPSQIQSEFAQLDTRTLKKLKKILSLPKHERQIIYAMTESFSQKHNEK